MHIDKKKEAYGLMKVYISGPITGVENYKAAFSARAASLKAMGYKVENPVDISERLQRAFPDRKLRYEDFMKHDLAALLDCDGISMLPGWEKSRGARIEHDVAVATGKIFVEVTLLDRR